MSTPTKDRSWLPSERMKSRERQQPPRPNGAVQPENEPAPAGAVWPEPLAEEAFHGVAGELVRLIEPHSEADPAALLLQFLIAWGSLAGRGPHYLAEADRHHSNEYVVIVGATAKGRKGTSWGHIKSILNAVDSYWTQERLVYGLGSGEALIDLMAEEDKRVLIQESEFSRLLAVVNRDGSTISSNIRNGWDHGTLEVITRQKKVRVQGAHLSLIGHITREELLRRLSDTEMANGFGNRILWACAKRSKLLPHGGGVTGDLAPIIRKLIDATRKTRSLGDTRLQFDSEARLLWEQVYGDLSEGKPGMLGSMTNRAEAHVVRLALEYALLDSAGEIRTEHLGAALEIWRYSEASAAWIWGTALGDPTADEILRALRATANGMTRWEIHNHFSRHKSTPEINRATGVLIERALISVEREETGGRPTTRYRAVS